MDYTPLEAFVRDVTNIQVLRMGGAAAALFGSAGADADTLNNLKKAVVAFATEYRKPDSKPETLEYWSDEVYGLVQMVQLTETISSDRAQTLLQNLDALMRQRVVDQ